MIHVNLKKIRLAKGVTQLHLAKIVGMSDMAYSRMENGKTKMDAEKLKCLSMELGVGIEVFFDSELTEFVTSGLDSKKVI